MSEIVKLPREVAEAIEHLRKHHGDNETILAGVLGNANGSCIVILREYTVTHSFDNLLQALVNGYEVEQTPEEKVREYYELNKPNGCMSQDQINIQAAVREGVLNTLNLLNIKIKGVNDQ